jgi:MATE family multidrug resistance protein
MELKLQTSYRQILGMALPISMAMLVPQINFIINNIFLGQLGERELASAGITGVYYLLFAVIGNGLNNGVQALIARRAGENRPKEIGRLFYHSIWLTLAIAAFGIIFTYTATPLILRAVIFDQEIAEEVISFLLIRVWGLPLLYVYIMRNALLVGVNQTKLLIYGTLSEAVVNIVLDYGLIYGKLGFPMLGFNGAAIASIIAEGVGLIVIYAVIRYKGLDKSFSFFEQKSLHFSMIKVIVDQSAPLILQYAVSIASWQFFYILIEHHGARALAISNTMRNLFGFFGVISWAFAATATTMVSNIIGQKRQEEVLYLVRKIATLSLCFALAMCIFLNVFPTVFLSLFGQDEAFIAEAIPVLRVVSVALVIISVGTVWLNAIVGTGNSVITLRIELLAIVVYCVYCYIVLEKLNMSIVYGWMSEWIYWFMMFFISFFYMHYGKWRSKLL